MRFGYRLSRLLGSVHSNANLVLVPPACTSVLTAVGNRVLWIDLVNHASSAMPFEARKDITLLSTSNDGRLLVVVDEDGRALLVNLARRVVLHRLNLKHKIRSVVFSPDDKFIAISVEKSVEVWLTPGRRHQFSPLIKCRSFGGVIDDVTCVAWAPDSQHLIVGSKDMTCKIFYNNDSDSRMEFLPSTLAGHRDAVLGVFFGKKKGECFSVSKDCAVMYWTFEFDENIATATVRPEQKLFSPTHGKWKLEEKIILRPESNRPVAATSADMSSIKGLLVIGYNIGVFGLYEIPGGACIHTLSIGSHAITTAIISKEGEWLAFGNGISGQLLVWEWQSESYVLKQAGHSYGLNAIAFSPNGAICATGGEDGKVKLWSVTSGFCYATFAEHEGPITAVTFVPGGGAILSSSLDGTIKAHDLSRYRCFRTLVTPSPAQLTSLAVDPAGEVVVAGSASPFELYVWSLQTGKVLDVFGGHEGPLSEVAFSPTQPIVATASWDGTVKLWNIYKSELVETLEMPADVLAVAFRPDGRQLCCACLNGTLQLWDVEEGSLQLIIEGHRDAAGGRYSDDKIMASSNSRSKHFTSVAYSADGSCVLAGGETRHVCLYACGNGVLVRKFQVSHNRSLEGVLDELHGGKLTEAGSLDQLPASDSEEEIDEKQRDYLPGASRGDFGKRKAKEVVRTTCVRFSPTGQEWGAATPMGVLLFTLDDVSTFTPTDLDEEATPTSVKQATTGHEWTKSIIMALHLGEAQLLDETVDAVPMKEVMLTSQAIPTLLVSKLLYVFARKLESGRCIEYHLIWIRALFRAHGPKLRVQAGRDTEVRGALRAIHKAITGQEKDLFKLAKENQYSLNFMTENASFPKQIKLEDSLIAESEADNETLENSLGTGKKSKRKRSLL